METYHKINAPFKRDMDGSITGQKGKLMVGQWALPEFEYLADNEWEFTEKVDGTNIRIGFHNNGLEFGGRSDNAVIPKPLLEYLNTTFDLDKILPHFDIGNSTIVTLFGEGYGPKIQGGGKYREDHSFVLFDVRIGDYWLSRDNVNDIADKLGIESVPVIGTGTLWDAIDIVSNGLSSEWGGTVGEKNEFEAEGIVARPTVTLFNRRGERIITKVKAVDFR
jgi:hypothetical protein